METSTHIDRDQDEEFENRNIPRVRRGGKELGKKRRKQEIEIKAKERQRQALELRKAGATYDKIAGQLGYASASGAHKAVSSALESLPRESAEALRQVQHEQINQAMIAIYPRVQKGELAAIDRFIKLQQRQAELHGLDATKFTVNANVDMAVVQIGGDTRSYIDKLREARGELPTGGTYDGDGVIEAEIVE